MKAALDTCPYCNANMRDKILSYPWDLDNDIQSDLAVLPCPDCYAEIEVLAARKLIFVIKGIDGDKNILVRDLGVLEK